MRSRGDPREVLAVPAGTADNASELSAVGPAVHGEYQRAEPLVQPDLVLVGEVVDFFVLTERAVANAFPRSSCRMFNWKTRR
jgi:hypothetical protein